jgi:hypothetical protein
MRRIPTLSDVGPVRFLEDPQVGLLDLGFGQVLYKIAPFIFYIFLRPISEVRIDKQSSRQFMS